MYAIQNDKREKAALPGIEHSTLAGGDDGLTGLSVWRQAVAPGGATPPHRHDCEEVVVVASGRGELHVDGKVIAFGPDSTLIIPPNVPHQICNTGTEPLGLLAAFSASPVDVYLPDGERIALPWRT
jgi:mannose-6-phosphate isomerase-like protein (cupin superfamily)